MRPLIAILLSVFSVNFSYSQCNVQINAPVTNINCGDCVNLEAIGVGQPPLLSENFNSGSLSAGWSSNVTLNYNNPCVPPPDGTPAGWFGANSFPRALESVEFDVSCGGEICFEMRYSVQGDPSPCEGPDLTDEGVHLQFSTNGGANWTDIAYYDPTASPGSGNPAAFTNWNTYCHQIPPAAMGTNTKFRWYQDVGSGNSNDHWGLDNITITANDCGYYYDWLVDGTSNSPDTTFCPTNLNTTYDVIYTNGTNDTCTASVNITINSNLTIDLGPDIQVNCGATTNITANPAGGSGNYDYQWNGNPGQTNQTLSNVGPGTYYVDVTDAAGGLCTASDTIVVTENTVHIADFTFSQACDGDPMTFTDNTAANGATLNIFLWDFDGDGNTDDSGTPVDYTFPGPGNYTVELQVEDLGGCTSVITHNVTVDPLPNPTIDPVADLCVDAAAIALTGNPAGGTFSGTGVAGNNFDPTTAGTGTHTVTYDYTDGNGCSNSTTADIDVIALPNPSIDPVSSLCVTSPSVPLTGNPAGGTFSGTGVAGNNFDPATSGTGTHTVTYDYTDGNGCSASTTIDITVVNIPTVGAGADYSICDGEATTLTANNPDGANIIWDNSVTDGVAFNPVATNTYEVTADIGGCINTDQITITVNPNPTFAVAGTDPAVCGGPGTITLSGLTPNTAYDVSYDDNSATVGPNNMNSDVNGDITINEPAGSYNNFVVTNPATGCTTSDPTSINLTDPNAPPIGAGPDQTICVGENVTLTANNPNGVPINWSGGITDGVAFSPATIGTNTYTVTANDNGCISSDQVNVTVLALPNVVANTSSQAICENESVTLFGSGALNYAWDNGVNDNVAFTPVATTTYTVTGTDGNGCQNTDQVTVTVNPLPVVDFQTPDINGCEPHTANFVNLTPNSSQCAWSFGDGGTSGTCGNLSHTYSTEGCYDVTLTVTDVNGCTNSTTKIDYVCVDKLPIADFSQSDEYVTESTPYVDFFNQTLGADSYEWTFNVTETSTDINPTVEFPTLPGTYEVVLVAYTENGCTDTAWSDVHVEEEILFYVPNTFTPDGDEFNEVFLPIMTSGFNPYEYTLFVFNRWGEPVFESHNTEVGWNGIYQGQLAEDGVYVWQIEFKDNLTDKRRTYRGHVNLLK